MMISEPIHIELVCKIKYRKEYKIDDKFIDDFIDKVERLDSFVTGTSEEFVLSAYRKDVNELNLINIIHNYILTNIKLIKYYKISIHYR